MNLGALKRFTSTHNICFSHATSAATSNGSFTAAALAPAAKVYQLPAAKEAEEEWKKEE